MNKVNINNWDRKDIFKMYSSYSNPYYCISFNLDIDDLKKYTQSHNVSFYKTMIYCVTTAVNMTDAFLYVYKDGDIYHIDRREASYTQLNKENNKFRFMYAETDKGFDNFIQKADKAEKEEYQLIDNNKESDELIHITCLPWLDITGFTNARDLSNKCESIPKFTWGQYKVENNRYTINMSLEVNHAFIDGIHIKEFKDNFYKAVKQLGE